MVLTLDDARTACSRCAVPMTFVAIVPTGSVIESMTSACAARCRTISGALSCTASRTACASRRSPSIETMRSATRACWNSAGSLCGASANPYTRAPMPASHSDSHAPLNPVWPVTRTRRPDQKDGSTVTRATPSMARRHRSTILPAGSCRAACPSAARSPCGDRRADHPRVPISGSVHFPRMSRRHRCNR